MVLPQKIVFLTPGFPENEADENCFPYIQDFLLNLMEFSGVKEIIVISFRYPFFNKPYYWNNILVYPLNGGNRKGLYRLKAWINAVRLLRKINSEGKIDIVHSFWLTECALVGGFFNRFFKIKHVSTIMGQDPLKSNRYLKLLNFKNMKVVGVSSFCAAIFYKNTGYAVFSITPFAIHEAYFNKLNNPLDGFDIMGLGNLGKIKNYSLFIEVVEAVAKQFPDIRAAIIGNGEEKECLQQAIRNKNLGKNIQILGELPRSEAITYMFNSKVFLHTSVYEGQAYVLDEALAAGMQVVSTNVADASIGQSIMVGEGFESLANQVIKALHLERRKPISRYSPKKAIEDYMRIYSS